VIEAAAAVGGTEEELIAAYDLEPQLRTDGAALQRLRTIGTRGSARKKLSVRLAIDRRARRTVKGAGSVHAQLAEARAFLAWDQHLVLPEPKPDTSSAHASLKQTLLRLARVESEELGREVSPPEILFAEVYPKEGEEPSK
jgi:hypothetical protein